MPVVVHGGCNRGDRVEDTNRSNERPVWPNSS